MNPSSLSSLQLLAKSWTMAASGYNQIFLPKFAPWTNDSIGVLQQELQKLLPHQKEQKQQQQQQQDEQSRCYSCFVPCCGPGHELEHLAGILPLEDETWSIWGFDLAPGMIELARTRLGLDVDKHRVYKRRRPSLHVQVGNAMDFPKTDEIASKNNDNTSDPLGTIPDSWTAILCVFGLQQLPDPVQAIKNWTNGLSNEGGVLVVCYWPQGATRADENDDKAQQQQTEKNDRLHPWTRFSDIIQAKLQQEKESSTTKNDQGGKQHAKTAYWEDELIPAALSVPGTKLVQDSMLTHAIEWENAEDCFESMTRAGPLHALRLRRGDDFVDGLKQEFCAPYPPGQKLSNDFEARLIVILRQGGSNDDIVAS
mmetsp:Transcript_20169/g.37697  ORF Transcript_20169/g.37697 Transcript_20169/m.37697 type:complete len:368 (-) Transcript_20169:626-1729(-)